MMHDEHPRDSDPSPSPEQPDGRAPIIERPRAAPPADPWAHLAREQPPAAPHAEAPRASSVDEDGEMDGEEDGASDELVVIRTFGNMFDAEVARMSLEGFDIPAVLSHPSFLGRPTIRLAVPEWAVEEAEEVLRGEDEAGDDEEGDEEPRPSHRESPRPRTGDE
jgi:hypothetical protein